MKFGTLQVYPRQGLLKEHGLEFPTAVVGRGEGAGISVDDFSVARRHARLTVESGKLLIEDLGTASGTFVDGERLEPGVRHLVAEGAVLRFGDIEARYLAPETAEVQQANVALDEEMHGLTVAGLSTAIASPEHPIEPGKQAAATLVVLNRGKLVDNVRIEIPDLPADWYTIDTPSFPILPGGRADVRITLHPPRRHDSLSGAYTFTARVRSQEYEEHPEVEGAFDVLPFDSATLTLEAIRSKKNFRVLAENHGNAPARYLLNGRDDEQAFRYLFETTAVELRPGEKRIVALQVKRPRQLTGYPSQPPFEVVGVNEAGAEITARGQLTINPPLQKFRVPAIYALMALILGVTALAVLVLTDGNGTKTASAEDPYAGVHLCEDADAKAEQEKKNADAADDKPLAGATVVGPYNGGRPIFGEVDRNGAPFFAQSDARWATQEYARSTELPNGKDWCGTTIEQCGCAMTSVSVMLALYDLLQMPDGQPLSPKTLNDWFNGAARQTDRGWVSRGYIYGDVIWAAANELSGEIAKIKPGARTVRFVRTGRGTEEEIRADLQAGRPVIVEVPGHWIAAVGLDGDDILINDPFYRDRKTLDVYAGKVRSSVHYEPSSDLSSVVITAPADVKFKVTDKQGRVVNTGLGTIDQPTDQLNQIPGASVSQRHAWRDPTCIETAPPADAGTNQVVLPGSADDYIIEIVDTGSQPASVAVHTYGRDGTASIATIDGREGTQAELQFDPNADKPVINIANQGTPVATATPPAGGAGGGEDTPTPAPTALPQPTATQTPFIEQRTAMTLAAEAGQTRVEVATNSGFELGDPIRFAPGLPNEEDNIIVGFGSFILATPLKFSHGPGEPILRLQRPPGQGPGLPPGITPPPDTGPIEPPKEVQLACSTIYQSSPKLATFICDVQVVGDFTTTRWTINGQVVTEFSGSTSFVMTFPGDTPANISATVCNVTLCRSTSKNERVEFPPASGSTSTTGGGTGGTTGAIASPTPPPAGAVVVTCGTEFDQNVRPTLAIMKCTANFSGEYTTVSWSAPGASPASQSGPSKTFETRLSKEDASAAQLKISATVCNFGTCRTSQPFIVGIGKTQTVLNTQPEGSIHQRHTLTLFAAVFGLNGIVPQGGTVQFYADSGQPLGTSAQLFTVGGTSVAQTTVNTATGPLSSVSLHTIYAEYSGGINAFGSVSPAADFLVKEPLPDGCDSVDEDVPPNGDTDETCDFSVPKNLGGGTVLQSLVISGGRPDGLPNAVRAAPEESLTVTGTVTRTEYCPGCVRQVYLGLGGYDTTTSPLPSTPQCKFNNVIFSATPPLPLEQWTFTAPKTPGVYYIRATTTLNYFCVATDPGPPDLSVGRIVVEADVVAQVDAFLNSDTTPTNPWDDVLTGNGTGTAESGQRLVLRAKVPPGATGSVEFFGFQNAAGTALAVAGNVCPPSGTVPRGLNVGHACVPGEARAAGPEIPNNVTNINITARYTNPDPLRLLNPANGFGQPVSVIDYPIFGIPDPPAPTSTPDPYPVRILIDANVTLTASPGLPNDPVQMGQQFTLTATVAPLNPPTTGTATGDGGTVQFMAGTNPIGTPVTVVGGQASISWTPRTCHNTDNPDVIPNCPGTNEGFPFDSQDQKFNVSDEYQDIHAVFTPGTSDLKSGQSSNIDVDINPATSVTAITAVSIASPSPLGTSFTITATVTATGFTPVPGVVTFRADGTSLGTRTLADSDCTVVADVHTCTVTSASIPTGGDNDTIDDAGTYALSVRFGGSSQLDESTSTAQNHVFELASPNLTLTLPNGGTITVGDTDPPGDPNDVRAVVSGTPSNRLDDSPAQLIYRDGTTVLDTDSVGTLSGVLGSEMEVSTLDAGTYSITVEYTGNAYFSGTTSAAQTLTVNQFTPTLTMNSITAVAVGNDLTVTATLQCGSGACSGIRSHAGGSVSFYRDSVSAGNLLATDSDISTGGTASVTLTTGDSQALSAAATAYSIVARFNGDATNGNLAADTTDTAASVTLLRRASTTTTAPVTANLGDPVSLSATVSTGSVNVSPDCTACVQFKYGSSLAGATNIGTPVNLVGGAASLPNVTTGAGTPFSANTSYTIWADYAGVANVNPSNDSATLTLATSVTVTASAPASVVRNTAATLSATVAPSTAPGTIQFKVNGTNFGSPQTVSSGSASISWTPANVGTFDITAAYSSSSNNYLSDPDSNTVSVTVTPSPTTVSVATPSGTHTGTVGVQQNFTVTATAGVAGTVKLFANGVEVDSEAADTDGTSTLEWTPANTGDDVPITASFTPTSANFAPSTSGSWLMDVNPVNVTVTLSAPPNVNINATFNISITVSPAAAGGSVQLYEGNSGNRTAVAGKTATIAADGTATISFTAPATAQTLQFSVLYTSSDATVYETNFFSNIDGVDVVTP